MVDTKSHGYSNLGLLSEGGYSELFFSHLSQASI